jgi:hypothetical protein
MFVTGPDAGTLQSAFFFGAGALAVALALALVGGRTVTADASGGPASVFARRRDF